MAPLLQIERCTKRFGGLVANRDVSLTIEPREIVGLIGPNGAGKTTLFSCISGSLHPDEGRIVLDGTDITRARPERVCRPGIARTWQVVRSFGRMSLLENVICGALRRTSRIGPARARALELLAFAGLAGKEDVVAAALTLADKKRLEITRALATAPRLLLLDEAMSGLTPYETTAAVELVRRIHSELGLAICVVEHVMEVVMPLSHRVVVLDHGEKLTEGPPAHVAYPGGVVALHGVSLEVRAGEAVALVGANGAGKTTLLKTIAGLLTPRSGEIWFDGRRIDDVEAPDRVDLGIAPVAEGRRLFSRLSVAENSLPR